MHNTNYSDAAHPTAQMLSYASLVFSAALCTEGLRQARGLWGGKGHVNCSFVCILSLHMHSQSTATAHLLTHDTNVHTHTHTTTHTYTDSQLHTKCI